jgi:hypothetical protein
MRHAHCLGSRSFNQEVRYTDFLVGEAVLDDQAVDLSFAESFSVALN